MKFVEKFLNALVGRYFDISPVDAVALKLQAKRIVVGRVWWYTRPVHSGVYVFEFKGQDYFICRTGLGFFFPSLFRLKIDPKPCLVPHPFRFLFGLPIVFFLAAIPFVTLGASIQTSPLAIPVGVLFFLIIVVIAIATTRVEKKLALMGFEKFCRIDKTKK